MQKPIEPLSIEVKDELEIMHIFVNKFLRKLCFRQFFGMITGNLLKSILVKLHILFKKKKH